MVFLYIIFALIGLGSLLYLIGIAIGIPLFQLLLIALTTPIGMFKGARLAFTKGSNMYKWRWVVIADFIIIALIIAMIVAD